MSSLMTLLPLLVSWYPLFNGRDFWWIWFLNITQRAAESEGGKWGLTLREAQVWVAWCTGSWVPRPSAAAGDFWNLASIWSQAIPGCRCRCQGLGRQRWGRRQAVVTSLSWTVPALQVGPMLAAPCPPSSCLDICHWCVSPATSQSSFPPSWVLS